jgi:RNA polymerase sigma-70 factor (ECF subfamily)
VLHDIFAVPFDEIAPIVDRSPEAAPVAGQALFYSRLALEFKPALVNGAVGMVSFLDGEPYSVAGATVRGGKIVEMDFFADRDRLRELDLRMLDD